MEKTRLSPARLYAQLSQEFGRMRPAWCASCRLPAIEPQAPADEAEPNWTIHASRHVCDACNDVIRDLVRTYGALFDLVDPTLRRESEPPGAGGYAVDARVDFLHPGLFRVKVRALDAAGNEMFALTAEAPDKEAAASEQERLVRQIHGVVAAARTRPGRRRA